MIRWFEELVVEKPNIVSSRVRLARNWSEYVFPSKLTDEEGQELVDRLSLGLKDLGELDGRVYEYAVLKDLDELDRLALWERKVYNSSIVQKEAPVGLLLSEEEDVSLVLNGTDHIRLQVIKAGLNLDVCYREANKIDDYINARFPYAFDDKYGYLTSFPTSVGTGMRACVVLHLPMLSMGKKFGSMLADLSRFGVSVKGVYGEGRENYGALYEISNQTTMGRTEKELLDLVTKVAIQLDDQENQVRRMALESHRLERVDEVYKSYGVLKYARRLSMKDARTFLSQLMLGTADGLIQLEKPCSVYRLMLGICTANLQKVSDRPLDKEELDIARASYLRCELPECKK